MRSLPAFLLASSAALIASGAAAQSAPPSDAPVMQAPPAQPPPGATPTQPPLGAYPVQPPPGAYPMQPPPGAYLPPGYAPQGVSVYVSPYTLPPGALPAPPPPEDRGTERRSKPMMIAGFTMAGVGVTALVLGALFYVAASSVVYTVECFAAPCDTGGGMGKAVGAPIAVMVVGGALFAAGLPMGIYGATKKPRELPSVALGPTSARLAWTF